jgi:hypothetical protein
MRIIGLVLAIVEEYARNICSLMGVYGLRKESEILASGIGVLRHITEE